MVTWSSSSCNRTASWVISNSRRNSASGASAPSAPARWARRCVQSRQGLAKCRRAPRTVRNRLPERRQHETTAHVSEPVPRQHGIEQHHAQRAGQVVITGASQLKGTGGVGRRSERTGVAGQIRDNASDPRSEWKITPSTWPPRPAACLAGSATAAAWPLARPDPARPSGPPRCSPRPSTGFAQVIGDP